MSPEVAGRGVWLPLQVGTGEVRSVHTLTPASQAQVHSCPSHPSLGPFKDCGKEAGPPSSQD